MLTLAFSFASVLACGNGESSTFNQNGLTVIALKGALPNRAASTDTCNYPFGTVMNYDTDTVTPATESPHFGVAPSATCLDAPGPFGGAGLIGGSIVNNDVASISAETGMSNAVFQGGLTFFVDDVAVSCDLFSDPPCLPRLTRQYPYLPTGVIMDPMRHHYSHLRAGLRYDAINVDDGFAPEKGPKGIRTGAVRGLLSLTNTDHEDHHVKVKIQSAFFDSQSILSTSSGDAAFDNGDSAVVHQGDDAGLSPVVLTQLRSDCTKKDHHWNIISTRLTEDDTACPKTEPAGTSGDNVFAVEAKVLVHAGETVIVAGVHEIFKPTGAARALHRLRNLERRHHKHDLHWFADLTDAERASIVNFCVDDDDADDSDDDDSSDGSSNSASKIQGNSDFSFGFVNPHDQPWQDRSHRRRESEFSNDLTSSALYKSSVSHVSSRPGLSSSSSSSSSSSRGTGWGDAWFAQVKAQREAELEAAAAAK